jgi:type I restriction enzyme M protein
MTGISDIKVLLKILEFSLEEGSEGIWVKSYSNHGGYKIKINIDKETIDYGKHINIHGKSTSNFKASENFVVLECVNRLLEKGYKPKNICLEKTWATGHGTSGRLDILVTRDNGSAYLMIECKTYGAEFDKEFKRILKDGGQLFTYFQQDKNADILMLYSSEIEKKGKIQYRNEIVKIEDDYRQTGNVKDFYDRWNKLPKNNGVFDTWVKAYDFQSKALTPKNLKDIKQEDSGFIFNQFLEILRHNVVSDKPNAFNKIFTLFLCKIYDEKATKANEELAFQWFYTPYQYEGINYPPDDNISFQKRLTDLYKKGMKAFLEKEVTDISDADFERKYSKLDAATKRQILEEFTEIRLKKNNEFAIKEVFNDDSFNENAKVVKEVVELLQGYKIRYTKKQQYLSDFFELLLTTGLKQESGQFFTPVPIAQFIIKSIPLQKIVFEKLNKGEKDNLLPSIIDYAAGSGHFLTESMHEVQRIIDKIDPDDFIEGTGKKISNWKTDHFDWAYQYVYGIEKDYRLVKVGKVGCYLHGDGLAQVIHSDGLANFSKNEEYKGFLKKTDKDFPKENKQFDIVISNPPYAVSAFKNNARKYYTEADFEIYDKLTDQSSEIECLFVERTKQLLKDGGIAGIILPSSILNNAGIYTKAREIILQYFDILAIAELGSFTFMATKTSTVTLFLRRRNNYDSINIKTLVKKAITDFKDVTINGIERPLSKYIDHVWEGIKFGDYLSLLQKQPNSAILGHEIYKEYSKNIKAKDQKELYEAIIQLEQEKLYYFILVYPQKIVLVKSGEKDEEKAFLGYEFSERRGNEGIHPIQRAKTIDECTQLYDPEIFDNPEKACTYIYKAFLGDFDFPISQAMQKNISRHNLVNMLTFDRLSFEKNISLAVKKKVKINSKWDVVKLNTIATTIVRGASPRPIKKFITSAKDGVNWIKIGDVSPTSKFIKETTEKITKEGAKKSRTVKPGDFILSNSMSFGRPYILSIHGCIHDGWLLLSNFDKKLNRDYLYYCLSSDIIQEQFNDAASGGTSVDNLNIEKVSNVWMPFPPPAIQEKIVAEMEVLEQKENKLKEQISLSKDKVSSLILDSNLSKIALRNLLETINPEKSEAIKNLGGDTVVSFLSMPDVSNEGQINNLQERRLSEVKSGFTFFQESDVLVAKITPCMENGKGALVPKIENNLGFGSTEFFVLRSNKRKIIPKLLFYITKAKDFREAAEKEMTGASGHKRVPKSFIEKYLVPDFSVSQQEKIISEIETIEAQTKKLEATLAEIPQQKNAILKKYI